MIPRNIDLTENRDFGHGTFNLMDTLLSLDVDGEEMSRDKYDALVWWEGIFGQTRHPNRKKKLFDPDEVQYYRKWQGVCFRCGRSMTPWNNHGGICKDCDDMVEHSRIPWKPENRVSFRNATMDIFSMR